MPYVMVLPMTGNQWKTSGGSLGFLNSTCCRTLTKTVTDKRVATTMPICDGSPSCENCWDSGPATSCRTPIFFFAFSCRVASE